MTVDIYSKEGCLKCQSAKEKLKILKVDYREHSAAYHIAHHDGWRDDGSTQVLTANTLYDGVLPFIRVGDVVYDYSGAIKAIKSMKASQDMDAARA